MPVNVNNYESELQYFNLNLLSLLNGTRSHEEIYSIANTANENRLLQQTSFQAYLEQISSSKTSAQIVHHNLNLTSLSHLLDSYKGCVLALFHLGSHRNIITDLILSNYKIASPIAGKAYWDFYNAKSNLSPEYGDNLTLLEVEGSGVGLSLIRAARKSDILAIYVDGNMGPDGYHVEEGATEIHFCNKKIRVKAGVARLARILNRPILPVFSVQNTQGFFCLEFGSPITHLEQSADESHESKIMQLIYDQLSEKVLEFPEHWEYGLCFHRWLVPSSSKEKPPIKDTSSNLNNNSFIQFNKAEYMSMLLEGDHYTVSIETHKAFKLPFNLSIEKVLETGMSVGEFKSYLQKRTDTEAEMLEKLIDQLVQKRIVVVQDSTH